MQQLSNQQIEKELSDGLKYVREGRILELSSMSLAQTHLVADCSFNDHPMTPDIRGRALRSVLRWSIDRLMPGGKHSWLSIDWRYYNTLKSFFIDGLKVGEIAERMGIAQQTLYLARTDAITELSKIISAELRSPTDQERRKNYFLEDQYLLHTPPARRLLRLLTVFNRSMSFKLAVKILADKHSAKDLSAAYLELTNSGLVISDPTSSTLLIHPEISHFLAFHLNTDEQEGWHLQISQFFLAKENYFEAAQQLLLAGLPQSSANILLNYSDEISNNMQVEEMQNLILKFDKSELDEESWSRIQLLAGDNLKMLGDLDGAMSIYQKGLGAPTIELQAEAYYKRGMALFYTNFDEALAHYNHTIRLLSESNTGKKLLTRVYIARAQLFMREQQLNKAEESLELASNLEQEADRKIYSYLQSAWYYLAIKQNELRKAVEHGQQAWLAATEIGDSVRMAEMSHNLGMVYAQLGEIDNSKNYLNKSTKLAQEMMNLEMVALNHKTMGGLLFVQGDFEHAIEKYKIAWDMLSEMGNLNWLTHTAYDLAEAYGQIKDVDRFWIYFNKGIELAEKTGFSSMAENLEELRIGFGFKNLKDSLNDRQYLIFQFFEQNNKISNREYQTLAGISPRQALRDLQDLVEKGLIEKKGGGRSVYYTVPQNTV